MPVCQITEPRHILRQTLLRLETVEAPGNAAGDSSHGIGVAAQGDDLPDGILEACGFQEGDDGLGNRLLAGGFK